MNLHQMTRRDALKLFGTLGASGLLTACGVPLLGADAPRRVVIVGGGFGGATAAKYLKMMAPRLEVTLVEPNETYVTCPFSNLYLGGLRSFASLQHSYTALRETYGVQIIHQRASEIDADSHRVTLDNGSVLPYDRLVLSPGIAIRWGALEGYDQNAAEKAPHAWLAGDQTRLLKAKMEAMREGGTFILVAPENPYRCPPGPYERVSMVAHYFKQNNPTAKILLLDAKDAFSKQGLFQQGWKELYGDMIEWVGLSGDGKVIRVDADRGEVETEFGTIHQADVLNVIPPQRAGLIAERAGVTDDSGWVPVDPRTFAARQQADIYVIGDATQAAPMPKSGHVANNQAKVTAAAIIADLGGNEAPEPSWVNTCYSTLAPGYGITVANVFEVADSHLREVPGSGGVSPLDASAQFRAREAQYAISWYEAVTENTWGTTSR